MQKWRLATCAFPARVRGGSVGANLLDFLSDTVLSACGNGGIRRSDRHGYWRRLGLLVHFASSVE